MNPVVLAALLAVASFSASGAFLEVPPESIDLDGRALTIWTRDAKGEVEEVPLPTKGERVGYYAPGSLLLFVAPRLKDISDLPPNVKLWVKGKVGTDGKLKDAELGMAPHHAGLQRELARVIPTWLLAPRVRDCAFEEVPGEVVLELDSTPVRPRYIYQRSEAIKTWLAGIREADYPVSTQPTYREPMYFPFQARRRGSYVAAVAAFVKVQPHGKVERVTMVPGLRQALYEKEVVSALMKYEFAPSPKGFCGFQAMNFQMN